MGGLASPARSRPPWYSALSCPLPPPPTTLLLERPRLLLVISLAAHMLSHPPLCCCGPPQAHLPAAAAGGGGPPGHGHVVWCSTQLYLQQSRCQQQEEGEKGGGGSGRGRGTATGQLHGRWGDAAPETRKPARLPSGGRAGATTSSALSHMQHPPPGLPKACSHARLAVYTCRLPPEKVPGPHEPAGAPPDLE